MGKILDKRSAAIQHLVAEGQTLQQIATTVCDPPITWQELAYFNWGTDVAAEVNRELIEIVGCDQGNEANPESVVLKPSRGKNSTILLPLVLSLDNLPLKTHTIKVLKRLPAPSIEIAQLDRWFIPSDENCEIRYQIKGLKERANKVEFAVYASNYCDAATTAD